MVQYMLSIYKSRHIFKFYYIISYLAVPMLKIM
jgi:hypothetical protein